MEQATPPVVGQANLAINLKISSELGVIIGGQTYRFVEECVGSRK